MDKTHPFARLVNERRYRDRKFGEPPISIAEVAEVCGVSRPYFYILMTTSTMPALPLLERLSAGLGVSVSGLRKAFTQAQAQGWPARVRSDRPAKRTKAKR